MSDTAINVVGLGKQYRIGTHIQVGSFREALSSAAKNIAVKMLKSKKQLSKSEHRVPNENFVWALKNISLEVKAGQVLGIVGSNGSGKTTLLKILSRVTEPTEGRAIVRGRIGALLEVGTGFHSELTGRENIFLSGAILGMKRAELLRKFDEIVDFSGVEKFIDTPVKRYSSGMYLRLAFAVAAHLEPEILMVDEVLAVGDLEFQRKCLGKMENVSSSGRTILFVSHNMAAVRSLCDSAIWLERGQIRLQGEVNDVVDAYYASMDASNGNGQFSEFGKEAPPGWDGDFRAVSFEARTAGEEGSFPQTGVDAEFVVGYAIPEDRPLNRLEIIVQVLDMRGVNVFGCTTGENQESIQDPPSYGRAVCKIAGCPLLPGSYRVIIRLKGIRVTEKRGIDESTSFQVIDTGSSGFINLPYHGYGSLMVKHRWSWESIRREPLS